MDKIIYPAPLYAFLSYINRVRGTPAPTPGTKVLDCAAGGETPPLGLFHKYGYEAWGIDISPDQISLAQAFAERQGIPLNLRQADMRQIPFADETFDYVYEFHSIAHLTKADTGRAIQELRRVLKPGGLCFIGFMSCECWPIFGREENPGEFRLIEGSQEVTHSAYTDDEPDCYFADWKILQKEKNARWFYRWSEGLSFEDWMGFYDPERTQFARPEWEKMYAERVERGNYTHLFYIVQKPG